MKNDKKEETQKRVIIYIGEDDGYWDSIKNRLEGKYRRLEFDFLHYKLDHFPHFQSFLIDFLEKKPGFIYIDFSTNLEKKLRLANYLQYENILKKIPLVGLVDKKEKVEECLFAGVHVIHVKCGELHDVVYDPFVLAYPKDAREPLFARAKFEKDVSLICDLRICYITPTFIHAEGNIELEEGAIIELNTDIPKHMVPSRKYRVKSVDDKNLDFNYRYSYDLEFIYVDEPDDELKDVEENLMGSTEEQKELILKEARQNHRYKMADYQQNLDKSKKDVHAWVMHNLDPAKRASRIKIMVVDPKLNFIKETEKSLDEYTYRIFPQTHLTSEFREIYTSRPDIIGIQFFDKKDVQKRVEDNYDKFTHNDGTPLSDDEIEYEKDKILKSFKREEEKKSLDILSTLVKKIKSYEKYRPFIILFNCEGFSSDTIQESLKYPYLMANKGGVHLTTLVNLAAAFHKKNEDKFEKFVTAKIQELKKSNPGKYRKLTRSDFEEKRYYLSIDDKLAHANYRRPIKLKEMTESFCSFESPQILKLGTYRLDFPVNMSITLIPKGGQDRELMGQAYLHWSLIHSVGEEEKKAIRKYVNKIFFSDLDEKRKAEMQAFESLNEQEKEKRLAELIKKERAEELDSDQEWDDTELD